RPIASRDRAAAARLIRTVMPEFGASGPGFAILDPEVDDMFGAERGKRSSSWVVTRAPDKRLANGDRLANGERLAKDVVVGGGGFAPLAGGDADTCELRKMYFLPELRGLGLGQELLSRCIEGAKKAGYSRMYLETLSNMTQARALYERNGF